MPRATDPNAKKKTAVPAKTLGVDLGSRTVTHYVSTPTVDETGEVLLPRGADISRFKKSPTVFDVHSYDSKSVVGRNMSYKVQDDGHVAETRFADRPPTHPDGVEWRPDTLLHLYNTGDISGWSIGFNPMEWRDPTTKDAEKYGPDCRLVHTRYRVLEYSVAPLPCNEDALTLGLVRRGILSKRLADSLKSGRVPDFGDIRPARKVYLFLPGQALPPAAPPALAAPPAAKNVPEERVVKLVVATLRGALYAEKT